MCLHNVHAISAHYVTCIYLYDVFLSIQLVWDSGTRTQMLLLSGWNRDLFSWLLADKRTFGLMMCSSRLSSDFQIPYSNLKKLMCYNLVFNAHRDQDRQRMARWRYMIWGLRDRNFLVKLYFVHQAKKTHNWIFFVVNVRFNKTILKVVCSDVSKLFNFSTTSQLFDTRGNCSTQRKWGVQVDVIEKIKKRSWVLRELK